MAAKKIDPLTPLPDSLMKGIKLEGSAVTQKTQAQAEFASRVFDLLGGDVSHISALPKKSIDSLEKALRKMLKSNTHNLRTMLTITIQDMLAGFKTQNIQSMNLQSNQSADVDDYDDYENIGFKDDNGESISDAWSNSPAAFLIQLGMHNAHIEDNNIPRNACVLPEENKESFSPQFSPSLEQFCKEICEGDDAMFAFFKQNTALTKILQRSFIVSHDKTKYYFLDPEVIAKSIIQHLITTKRGYWGYWKSQLKNSL